MWVGEEMFLGCCEMVISRELLSARVRRQRPIDGLESRWYHAFMEKDVISIRRMADLAHDGFVPGTPAERISLVWPLTCEVLSLSKQYDVERRLQRDVTRIIRREG